MVKKNFKRNKQECKSASVSEKHQKLHEACLKNPTIVLGNEGEKPHVFNEPEGHAKDGFIEKFAKSSMLTHELEKTGKKIEAVPDSRKPMIKQQRRLDSEISSKYVNQNPNN